MRLFLLTALTMTAFAANSVLNRAALASGEMDSLAFGAIRLISGAAMLAGLLLWQGKGFDKKLSSYGSGVLSLLAYIFGFSLAYQALDPGFGALILFAVVQVTMFAGAVLSRETVPATRWAGAGLAFCGLAWLLWPSEGADAPVWPILFMVAAGVGWGIYSLLGRSSADALKSTAMNFVLAAPIAVLLWFALGAGGVSSAGVALACVSGAITSGLGYALWYRILPDLGASRAAVAQLSVPIIALAGGAAFLGEDITIRFAIASVLVIGGVLLSLRGR